MIDKWLIPASCSPLHRLYGQINIVEIAAPSDDVKDHLSKEIISSYRHLEHLKINFATKNEADLRKYIKEYVLPSDKNQITKNVRQGDFSEVLASLIVSFFQGKIVPLKKMKWKFNKDRSVFSTDMFAHNDGDVISDLYYYEIKSRLSTKNKETVKPLTAYITVHAHNSLLKDQQQPNEAIADFLNRYYLEFGDQASAAKYFDIVMNPGDYNKGFELFFIIESTKFNTAILDDLENLPPGLSPLNVTIVLIKDLAKLILDLKDRAIEQAVNEVFPKP